MYYNFAEQHPYYDCLLHLQTLLGSITSCWLVRGSLFIELGCTRDLGKGWRGDLGTFMISRSI